LEVLDPEQNHTFRDHYLEVELDLSDVLFLATANVVEAIPAPLLDRMELVELDGYTEHEKVTIARDHLLPRQLDKAGLEPSEVEFSEAALRRLASEYTREAGVRSLDRSIARVLRKIAANVALEKAELPVSVGADDLKEYLGRPRYTPEVELSRNERRTGGPGDRPGGHRGGRRRPLHRGVAGRQGDRRHRRDAHRPPRRRHEGVGADRAQLPAVARGRAGASGRRPEGPRRPRPRARRRDPEGRAERGHHDDDGAGVAAVGAPGAAGRGDDRRDLADRAGAADRRAEAE